MGFPKVTVLGQYIIKGATADVTVNLKELYGERMLIGHVMYGSTPSGYVTASACVPDVAHPQSDTPGVNNPTLYAPNQAPDMPTAAKTSSYMYVVKDYAENTTITLTCTDGTHDVWIECKQ